MDIDSIKDIIAKSMMDAIEQHGGDTSIFKDGKNHSSEEIINMLDGEMRKLSDAQEAEFEREKQEQIQAANDWKKYDINEIIARIDSELPPKPMVRLNPKKAENLSVFENKLGGVPYMPKDFTYPAVKSGQYEGKPLRLLAQLNFEKLPHIPNFPQKGILQFFGFDGDEYMLFGMDYDNLAVQNGFRVIYHENILTDESLLIDESDLPEFSDEYGAFPFDGEFLLEAEGPSECAATIYDVSFWDRLMKFCGEAAGCEFNTVGALEKAGFGSLEFLWEKRSNECFCIGGYPYFTQDDPRFADSYKRFDTLLLQINSFYDRETCDEIMWGDMGVGSFFIPLERLKSGDFSEVMFTWDCC